MTARLKYQLVSGGFWGLFMTLFNMLFEIKEKPLSVQLSTVDFYVRALAFILVGIFVLGYINWKAKERKEVSSK